MSRIKTTQVMVTKNGDYVEVPSKVNNKVFDLHDIVKKNFKDVVFHGDYIFSHKVNGQTKTSLLLRIVGSGVQNQKFKKRVQIHSNMIDRLIDDVIVIYSFRDTIAFVRFDNSLKNREFPKSLTTLFWIKIQEIAKCFEKKHCISITKHSKVNGTTEVYISESAQDLYSDRKTIEKVEESEIKNDNELIINLDFEEEIDKEDNRAEIGRLGEEIVNNLLKTKKIYLSNLDVFIWQNENTESGKPFDFKGDKFFLEVKASSRKNNSFLLSENEMKILRENTEEYFLVFVGGVSLERKTYDNIQIFSGKELLDHNFKEIINITYQFERK